MCILGPKSRKIQQRNNMKTDHVLKKVLAVARQEMLDDERMRLKKKQKRTSAENRLGVKMVSAQLVIQGKSPTEVRLKHITEALNRILEDPAIVAKVFQYIIDPGAYYQHTNAEFGMNHTPITIVQVWYYLK